MLERRPYARATDGERSEFQLHAAKGLDNDSPDCGARVMFTASV